MKDDPSWTLSDRNVRRDIKTRDLVNGWSLLAVVASIILLVYFVGMVWVLGTIPHQDP